MVNSYYAYTKSLYAEPFPRYYNLNVRNLKGLGPDLQKILGKILSLS